MTDGMTFRVISVRMFEVGTSTQVYPSANYVGTRTFYYVVIRRLFQNRSQIVYDFLTVLNSLERRLKDGLRSTRVPHRLGDRNPSRVRLPPSSWVHTLPFTLTSTTVHMILSTLLLPYQLWSPVCNRSIRLG